MVVGKIAFPVNKGYFFREIWLNFLARPDDLSGGSFERERFVLPEVKWRSLFPESGTCWVISGLWGLPLVQAPSLD